MPHCLAFYARAARITAFLWLLCLPAGAQPVFRNRNARAALPENYVALFTETALREPVEYLAGEALGGRETGSAGAQAAARYLQEAFEQYGLRPFTPYGYVQTFTCANGAKGQNVLGVLPAAKRNEDRWIIVSAHYDHIGTLDGVVYPGANANASGVAALLNLARVLGQMHANGHGLKRNILFVCYDAKEFSMEGARVFDARWPHPYHRITANINLDQLGSISEPPGRTPQYALVIEAENNPAGLRRALDNTNSYYHTGLDIDYTFYQSPAFARIYFEMTEQQFLAKNAVPSLLVTSGVSEHTYKPQDTPATLDYSTLLQRCKWLFFALVDIAQPVQQ